MPPANITKPTKPKRTRQRSGAILRPHYTSGKVAKVIGCSPRTASNMLDRHTDLVFRIDQDRRVTHDNLLLILARENITPKHINLNQSSQFAWIGSPVPGHHTPSDVQMSPVGAIQLAIRNEVCSIACINHELTTGDVIKLADTVGSRSIRIAAKLADDAAGLYRKSEFVWLYSADSQVSFFDVMCWLRGVELSAPETNTEVINQ